MLSRRTFLISGTALAGFAAVKPALSWMMNPAGQSDSVIFFKLSLLLTNRTPLSQLIAQRALHCLTAEDASFPQKMQQLCTQLDAANISIADDLIGHPLNTGANGDTVKTILSAWYLGYTGKPVPLRALDNTRFVSYTHALAFTPTLDATVIPSYSRGKTNYWIEPPATLKND